jgi:hypothetical protein
MISVRLNYQNRGEHGTTGMKTPETLFASISFKILEAVVDLQNSFKRGSLGAGFTVSFT